MKINIDGKLVSVQEYPANTSEEKAQRLIDRVDIIEVMREYARRADNCDANGMASCFTEDSVSTYWFDGPAPLRYGRKGLLEFLCPYFYGQSEQPDAIPINGVRSHYYTNEQILFLSAESAIYYCNMYSWRRVSNQWGDDQRWGRYECSFAKKGGEWRIQNLKLLQTPRTDVDSWPPAITELHGEGR